MLLLFLNACPLQLLWEKKKHVLNTFCFLFLKKKKLCRKEVDGNHCEYPTSPLTWESGKKLWPEKKKAAQAKQIRPRVKQLTFVFLSYFSYFLGGSCGCVRMTLTLLRSGLRGRYQWAKPDALSLGNLASHSCTAPAAAHITAWTAGRRCSSTMLFLVKKPGIKRQCVPRSLCLYAVVKSV